MIELSMLQKIPLFDRLSEKQVKKIQRFLHEETVAEDVVVIREGEKGHEMYILVDGEVQISRAIVGKGQQAVFDQTEKSLIRLSGDDHAFFGEMAILDPNSVRIATVTTTKKTKLALLRRSDFYSLAKEDLDLAFTVTFNIARILSSRLSKANEDILKLTLAFTLALQR